MNESTIIQSNNHAQGELFHLSGIKNRKIEVSYTSPDTSSYGGLLLLREVEQQSAIIDKMTHVLEDTRQAGYICHSYKEMLTQRIMQIAIGYEDADDCDSLRHDSILKMCTGRLPESKALSSQPTMSRLENRITISELYAMAENFVTGFISSYESAPESIVLDIDDSNFNTYGDQQYTLFSNYYRENCYMPFFIFEGISGKLILPLLRPGRRSKQLNIFGVMRRVIELLRRHWKDTVIVIRGANQFRLFLHGAAYSLLHTLKNSVLANTSFKNVSLITLREKFLLVAVHVKTCKTKIKVELPVNYPHKEEFSQALLLFEYLRLTR